MSRQLERGTRGYAAITNSAEVGSPLTGRHIWNQMALLSSWATGRRAGLSRAS
jgi:hypothetical protein